MQDEKVVGTSTRNNEATRVSAQAARGRAPMEREARVIGQPGFILHSYPYKETSRVLA